MTKSPDQPDDETLEVLQQDYLERLADARRRLTILRQKLLRLNGLLGEADEAADQSGPTLH